MNDLLRGLSLERLEQEIASYYWEAAKVAPGVYVRESGVLAALWEEFDRRAEHGLVDDE